MTPLLPKDFFDPIHSWTTGDIANPYSKFLMNCPYRSVILGAMHRASDAGQMARIEGIDDRDFPEGHAWNALQSGNVLDLRDNVLATEVLRPKFLEMVATTFGRHFSLVPGEPVRIEDLRAEIPALVERLEAFLTSPEMHVDAEDFPRNTSHVDRDVEGRHFASCYLVSMRGWGDLALMERRPGHQWEVCTEQHDPVMEM